MLGKAIDRSVPASSQTLISNSTYTRRKWKSAFNAALALSLVTPAAAFAESNEDLSREVQELKAQVKELKQQVGPAATADPKTSAIVEEATADDSKLVTSKGATLKLGGLKLTLGGFIAAEGVFRSRNETADVGSNFTAYPFANNQNYYTSEFRETARQSRVQLLAQGPGNQDNKLEAFIAADFLSAGTTSNSNETNSYTLRVREAYATWARKDLDFYVLAGQSWSLATLYKKGLNPRSEDVPLTIEAQYVPGFNWLRTPQFRVVKNFGSLAAVGVSLETPQNLFRGTVPTGGLANNPGVGGGLLNPTANYSSDIAPDITFKAAFDPGFGHYEIYSLTRFFRDRTPETAGVVSTSANHTTVAESIGGGLILPVIPKYVDFQVSGIVGHGNGRYGSSTLGDSTFKPGNGAFAALEEQQALVGFVAHPNSRVDLYTYGGIEHLVSSYGYGVTGTNNAGCYTLGSAAATCNGPAQTVRQITGGAWWKFYKGSIGYLSAGAQASYTTLSTFTAPNGTQGRTNDTTVLVSFRYYPYQ